MEYSIDEIMDMLSSDDAKIQEKGVDLGLQVKNLRCFIRPIYGNPSNCTWENCAKIVSARSDKELRYYFDDLLMWISDMKCPGATKIFERLVKYEDKHFFKWALETFPNLDLRIVMKYPLETLMNSSDLNIKDLW